jgi:hypothetical protein
MVKARRRFGPAAAALLIGLLAIAAASYFRPLPVAGDPSLSRSSDRARVERGSLGLEFSPLQGSKSTGLLLYPGARVPPEAYAYLGKACAEAGFTSIIVSFPFNFAVFAPGKAAGASAPGVSRWVLGGHSLGGAMACSYAASHPIAGLLLLGAYPGSASDLSGLDIDVVSLAGSRDGLATPEKLARSRRLLPVAARIVEITGGNNAQFGEYGPQAGDGAAEIDGSVQRRVVVEEAIALLGRVETGAGN